MSLKDKSPSIKSMYIAAISAPVNTPQNSECLFQQERAKSTENSFNTILVHATTPEQSFGSPKIFNPSSEGSLYQWRSPNTFNNSSNQNDSSSDTSQEACVCYEYSPIPNKFKKKNYFNNSNLNNKNNEQYYHPSMLEDPWT
ncbi:Hypothetical protein CINCED_3A021022 [Cinara cedri]|uniref:Uncharacterized protein n=1 Tax=Cinara cedri TaxID=506608 RepID=A0A5E4MBP1_9HEMI|nr:Hypothetical protein CINCED_3A021022 [Cinara cedri]